MTVDRERILAELSRTPAEANDDGFLAAFGLPLTRLPADLWHGFAHSVLDAVGPGLAPEAEAQLVDAAEESGYHLGYGIITSDAWRRALPPGQARLPEEMLRAACAAFAACGWPEVEVSGFVANERLALRGTWAAAGDSATAGCADTPRDALVRGLAAALMDLVCAEVSYPDGLGAYCCAPGLLLPAEGRVEFVATRA